MTQMSTGSHQLLTFKTLLNESKSTAVFTGAGISTDSGIPDFRSDTGLWTRMKPIQFQDFIASEAVRQEAWQRKFDNQAIIDNAKPNQGHLCVAKLARQGKVIAVITQNVDGLHQQSGIPDSQVIELHGNSTYAACLACGKRYELDDLQAQFEKQGCVLPCAICRGLVKTATISFGQSMPVLAVKRAEEAIQACDFCLVLGSSLVVHPAASLPVIAKQAGAKLAIINRDETPLDDIADLVIRDSISQVLSFAMGQNEG